VRIAVIHGPNLNHLGRREPAIYGTDTLAEIDDRLHLLARELGVDVATYQSNAEGALIDYIQGASAETAGFVVNAGGLTHSSVSLRDALTGSGLPFVEVHLTNPSAREPFRHTSLLADRALGVVVGFGADSYLLGLRGLVARLKQGVRAAAPGS
jgi:3-dehydroquinate dehydratase II